MADNLPLIPQKDAICGEARRVLREVFREQDWLPPLVDQHSSDEPSWAVQYSIENQELWQKECELKEEHAKRISREPLPNIYRLSSPDSSRTEASWKIKHGIITRRNLVPPIETNACRDASLWVKNILNSSSCEVSGIVGHGYRLQQSPQLTSYNSQTFQSVSIGQVEVRPLPPSPPPAEPPPPEPQPEYILCIPQQLEFVNFTIDHLHSQSLRLVNTSKFEVRLSVRPPSRRELSVMVCGKRGLTVTSGAAAELRVLFTPRDVRAFKDTLVVRVSAGKSVVVPIRCYMEPPVLHVLVPNLRWCSLSCCEGETPLECASGGRGGEVIELGAHLLGDLHYVQLLLHCAEKHAAFFLVTEDAWLSFTIDDVTQSGVVVSNAFGIWPVWWCGGGTVQGGAWCRAQQAGLQAAALRVLSSTAVHRPLHLIADSLHFSTDHLTIEAHEKDYDICSDDDPACEYYVHLGTALPNRALNASIQIINHSPIVYAYYWSVRPWGVCSCWEDERASEGSVMAEDDDERLCVGAIAAREREAQDPDGPTEEDATRLVRVEPTAGCIAARSTCSPHVCVPHGASTPGVHRAVLMLILKDIPKESFPPNFDPMVVKTKTVQVDPLPGLEPWSREVCDVVCCQLEVWWEVVPVRFVLDPPILHLSHSRRKKKVNIEFRATQLWGTEGVEALWCLPDRLLPPPSPTRLNPANSIATKISISLPNMPDDSPDVDVFVLEDEHAQWRAESQIVRQCARRHPRVRPSRVWLGYVPPGAKVCTRLKTYNKTYQEVEWVSRAWPWVGEVGEACPSEQPCAICQRCECACDLLRPLSGNTPHRSSDVLYYKHTALKKEGCVATLAQLVGRSSTGVGVESRASLVAFRVLAPRLTLRVLPCYGEKRDGCGGCKLEASFTEGAPVLRPSAALVVGRRSCYRLRITNTTPLPTSVSWEPSPENESPIKVTFLPNDFDVGSYTQVEIRMVVEGRRVCGRRVYVRRARVDRALAPRYLLIDTAVEGLSVTYEIPLGGEEHNEGTVIVTNTQKEEFPWESPRPPPPTAEEMFLEEDRKRAVRKENICHCPYKMVYIPEKKSPRSPDDPPTPIEILTEPPPLTRVCACCGRTKPVLPEHEQPPCLQFYQLPLRTVWKRTIVVRNKSVLTAQWSACVRYWPRRYTRTLDLDQWSSGVPEAGVALEVSPSGGTLGPRATVSVTVSVYADTWGLYRDQLLISVTGVQPLVFDVWVEACGPPLQLALRPQLADECDVPTLWMSQCERARTVRVRNTSRSDLSVRAYTLREHEQQQSALPFRLLLRFFDVPPRVCPCLDSSNSGFLEEESDSSSVSEQMDTGVELYLSADYGVQEETFFDVEPPVTTVGPGLCTEFHIGWRQDPTDEVAPNVMLLLRTVPVNFAGPGWYRSEPAPQLVRIRQTVRSGSLRVSESELCVRRCALKLPSGDVIRIRKRFSVINVGNGSLEVQASTGGLWTVVQDGVGNASACESSCVCGLKEKERDSTVSLYLPPRSSSEMCVEVFIDPAEVCPRAGGTPCEPPHYPEMQRKVAALRFYDQHNILLTVPLILELEYPVLKVEPSSIEFGCVTDGDTRKTYFTVSHTSRHETLDLVTEWVGTSEFRLWPPTLSLPPKTSMPVYIQYTARWYRGAATGCARVCVRGAGGAWCRASLPARAAPARDHRYHETQHDYTDDTHLMPPHVHTHRYTTTKCAYSLNVVFSIVD